jgi:hypothetical protein
MCPTGAVSTECRPHCADVSASAHRLHGQLGVNEVYPLIDSCSMLTDTDCDARWTRLYARQYQLDVLTAPAYAACISNSPNQYAQCPQFPAPVEPTFVRCYHFIHAILTLYL